MGARIEAKDVDRARALLFGRLPNDDAADVCEVMDRLMAHRDEAERGLKETEARLRGYEQKPHPSDLLQVAIKQAEERAEKAEHEAQRSKYALIASQNEMLTAVTEYDQKFAEHNKKLDAVKKSLWDDLESVTAQRDKARHEHDQDKHRDARLCSELAKHLKRITALEEEREQTNELISASADLCERGRHAIEMLRGGVTVLELLLSARSMLGHVDGCSFTSAGGWVCHSECTAGVGIQEHG